MRFGNLSDSIHIPAAMVTLAMVAMAGCSNNTKIAVPENFEEFNSKDGSFALEYPAGWQAKGNGNKSSGIAWAEFTDAGARIRVDALFTEVIKGDLANMAGGTAMLKDEELRPDMTREEIVHIQGKDYYIDKYSHYVEDDGVSTRIKLGPAHVSGFAAKDGFSQMKGIRATITGTDRGITYFASCPANQWADFKPVFIRCLESMKRGVPKH